MALSWSLLVRWWSGVFRARETHLMRDGGVHGKATRSSGFTGVAGFKLLIMFLL